MKLFIDKSLCECYTSGNKYAVVRFGEKHIKKIKE